MPDFQMLEIDRERLDAARKTTLKMVQERSKAIRGQLIVAEGEVSLSDKQVVRTITPEIGDLVTGYTGLRVSSGRALVRMEDGTDIWLSKDTKLDCTEWTEKKRVLRLHRGRCLIFTVKDLNRPLEIISRTRSARAVGTTFIAECRNDSFSVSVLKGSVNVEVSRDVKRVSAGRSATIDSADQFRLNRNPNGILADWGNLDDTLKNPDVAGEAQKILNKNTNKRILYAALIILIVGLLLVRMISLPTPPNEPQKPVFNPLVLGSDELMSRHEWRLVHAQIIFGELKPGIEFPPEVIQPRPGSNAADPAFAGIMASRIQQTLYDRNDFGQVVQELTEKHLSPDEVNLLTSSYLELVSEMLSHIGTPGGVTRSSYKEIPAWNDEQRVLFRRGDLPVIVLLDLEAFDHPGFQRGCAKYGLAIWEPDTNTL